MLTYSQGRSKMIEPMRYYYDIHDLEHIENVYSEQTEDGQRMYNTPDGNKYPSVTTVIGLETREHIKLWRQRIGEEKANRITAGASRRGTKMHNIFENYLRAETDDIGIENPLQKEMFLAVQPVLDEITPIALEAPLWSDELRMAGRVDCIGILNDELCIIDFKTSAKHKDEKYIKSYFMQETAYACMVNELTGEQPTNLVTIVAIEGGYSQMFMTEPYGYIDDLVKLRKRYESLYGV